MPAYHKQYAEGLHPLIETSTELRVEFVHGLDWLAGQKGLTRAERRTIAELIGEIAPDLLAERDDENLKAIYNKHQGADYDAEEAAALAGMKAFLERATGLELDDDLDSRSPEEVLKWAQARAAEEQAQRQSAQQAQAERKAKRKKSAKQIAKEEKQQAAAKQIGQSIREVYRKLASALHPDRETDPEERERKTALMQRANQAYEKNNLLHLLELQLELEHIDQEHIDNLGEERLLHYNQVLKDQLRELDGEIFRVELDFKASFGFEPYQAVSPTTILGHLAKDILVMQRAIRDLKADLATLQDVKKAKAWLRKMHRELDPGYGGDMPF